ncbi:MAG TPA: magnesium transporter [Bacteroidota bacterium]|nr:magnesium transporter [Bacteroidota bacterium]
MSEEQKDPELNFVSEDPILKAVPAAQPETIDIDDELMQDIRELIRDHAASLLLNILTDLHASDIAVIVNGLDPDDAEYLFSLLDTGTGSALLRELNPETRAIILEKLPSEKITAYAGLLASDDAADLIAELPPAVAEKVLKALPAKESGDVQELMKYAEDTAGGIMGREFVAVRMNDTVAQAIREVRANAKKNVVIYTVYVLDDQGTLVGSLPLQSLVLHPPGRRVYRIMETEPKSIDTGVDQEEVASMFRKYDLVTLPVVDPAGRMVGRISIDDIVDVIEEEHAEDVAKLVGSDADEMEKRSPARIALMRLPWVLITLVMEFGAGLVIHYFDRTLSRVILLASFMPIISAISGNTGLQSAAIVVRAMATGHISLDRWWQPVVRQLQTTLIIGAACGIVLGVIGALWQGKWEFGAVVGISMLFAVNISGFIGTASPMLSKKFGFDPAVTAGPFETAFQDVVGITIFLSLSTSLLHWIA